MTLRPVFFTAPVSLAPVSLAPVSLAPVSLAPVSLATALLVACLLPAGLQAADSTRCTDEIQEHLRELPLAEGEVSSLRIIERTNIADDFGPEIFGVDAWVRLKSCSGWLVINMTPKCYIRQSYTRGDCRVEGLPDY